MFYPLYRALCLYAPLLPSLRLLAEGSLNVSVFTKNLNLYRAI